MNKTAAAPHPGSAARQRFSTRDLVSGGMFAALMAVISQLSIPMPSGQPITIQVFGAALIGVVLGWRLGFFSMVIYLLVGSVGLPVFANFGAGLSRLAGITGGYLWTFPVLALLAGIRPGTGKKKLDMALVILSALAGLIIVETVGGIQWSLLSGGAMPLSAVFTYAIVAFIPKDAILTVLAVLIGVPMRNMLSRRMNGQ
ncbi:MAG: biotin transporter BioY [Eubacteriales bacterium]|nr:biotin transporter BioY [Eubacteriales bacterium]